MPSPSRFTNTARKLEDDLPSGELQRAVYRLQRLWLRFKHKVRPLGRTWSRKRLMNSSGASVIARYRAGPLRR
jgi:hypothetical protein